ncbi:MAG: alpha/beta hydrolase [Caldilineaceae bacterium]|nr:alpha/beta hydrolase [Caldilineaceae bacterium]
MKATQERGSRVLKVDDFQGTLPTRALYVYLPPGYDDDGDRRYPVLYMHDGQNCFEAFAEESFAGSWKADLVADRLIAAGQMQPVIIVGVSNSAHQRMAEYLPPYATFVPPVGAADKQRSYRRLSVVEGQADRTFKYYRDEVAVYVRERFRVLVGREHTATCGSSLGGLFSAYIAWEHPEFARHHGLMSPSFWITCIYPDRPEGPFEAIERMRSGKPRDVRLWLDSGTANNHHGDGSDGLEITRMARDALLENGYSLGVDFRYYQDVNGIHHESSWSARLPKVYRFLSPSDLGTGHAATLRDPL